MAGNTPKQALTPSPKVVPVTNPLPIKTDSGSGSGVTTDTRIMTQTGPATVPFGVPTLSDPASVEMMKRWHEDEIVLDIASGAGYTVSRQQKEMRRKAINAANSTATLGCGPNIDVYTSTSNQGGLAGGQVGTWICNVDDRIKFRENQYQNQMNEFRLFIEGADVTNYVEGSISWTIESTGGMNSCRFTLNNTQDAFILTPENICSGLDPTGWRINPVDIGSGRVNWRVDESAKFTIYVNKYNAVGVGTATPQIDPETGMWLFPLNPYSCIFNRHDCVRLFVRLPHVSGVRSATDKKVYDLWMPAFTGFIKDYSWDDDPVAGTRYVKVTCYDYRGILERMRVAIFGAGVPSPNPAAPDTATNNASTPGSPTSPPNTGEPTKPGDQNKGPTSYDFLNKAKKLGADWHRWLDAQGLTLPTNTFYGGTVPPGGKPTNPYAWAFTVKLIDAFIDLYKTTLAKHLSSLGLNNQPSAPGPLVPGTTVEGKPADPNDVKTETALRKANSEMESMVCNAIEGIGQVMALASQIYKTTGVAYDVFMAGRDVGLGVPPRFDLKVLPAAANARPKVGSSNTEADREAKRQAIIAAYNKWASARSVGNAMPAVKVPTGCSGIGCPPTSIRELVTRFLDITVKGNASVYKPYWFDLNATLLTMIGVFTDVKGQYDNSSSSSALPKVEVYVPLTDLGDWTKPQMITLYVGSTPDAMVQAAVTKYLGNMISKVESTRKALVTESNLATPSSNDKSGSAIYYMVRSSTYNETTVNGFRISGPGRMFQAWPLSYLSVMFSAKKKENENAIRKQTPSGGGRQVTQWNKYAENVQQMHATGPSRAKAGANEVRTLGAIVKKFVEVDKAKVGLFGDLIEAVAGGHPHPLAGKSFEEAIHFLCTRNSELDCGVLSNIDSYGASKLDRWNRVVLFGAIQRPLTFGEMQEIGKRTIRDFRSDFCPLKAFYHMLLPANGVGVDSVVKMHLAGTNLSSPEEPTFTTRLQLLNEVCEGMDYQFFVNGMGDLIFELPVYNAYPDTYGPVFSGAYMITKDWISSTISEESADVPTAWVVSGTELTANVDPTINSVQGKDHLNKLTIMNHTMVRRLGVKVETIPLKIPGLGATLKMGGGSGNALQQLAVYAAFYIQRQLARAHSLSVRYPFRPYVFPNRPLWLVPRQRIGLATSVTHTMTPPAGTCTTDSTIGYVRWMFRDGTFRFIGGGDRQPMDYIGMFRGAASYNTTEGTLPEGPLSLASITPRLTGTTEAPSDLANRIRAANAFSTNVSASFAEIESPPSIEAIEQIQNLVLSTNTTMTAITTTAVGQPQTSGTPGTAAATATGPNAPVTANQKNQLAAVATKQANKAQNPPQTNPPPGTGTETAYARTGKTDFIGTGYSIDGVQEPEPAKKMDWNYLGQLKAWSYGNPAEKGFNSWGLLRSFSPYRYGEFTRGSGGSHHPGMDIIGIEGTRLTAPLPFYRIDAGMDIYRHTLRKEIRPTNLWNCISQFNSTPMDYAYPVIDPVSNTAVGGVPPVMKQSMVTNKFFVHPFSLKTDATALAYAEYYDQYVCLRTPGQTAKYCPKPYSTRGARGFEVNPNENRGLWFEGWAWYSPPADKAQLLGISPGARMRISLSYIHMCRYADDVVSGRGVLGIEYKGNVEAGTTIGYLGNTGLSRGPHLHVQMYVWPPQTGTDEAAFKAVAAANADFLTSQLVALATKWDPGSGPLNPGMLDGKVSPAMYEQARQVFLASKSSIPFKLLKARTAEQMTVRDLVELYKKDRDIGTFYKNKTNLYSSAKDRKNNKYTNLQTNPMFFFNADQLVDMRGIIGAVPMVMPGMGSGASANYGGSGPASGSPGMAYAPLGKSPAYDGTSLQWCAGLNGSDSRTEATATAKNQQAAATAGKNTAANPQNKAAEEEKLKQKLEKNNAPIKEAAASKAAARAKPESVRRRYNAMGARGRKTGGGPPIPGGGVSADTGSKKK